MHTYKFKIQKSRRNRFLFTDTVIIKQCYNHFVALSRRYYAIYGKSLSYERMSSHLTKLKKLEKYADWRTPHSWALQNCLRRLADGYQRFFDGLAKRRPKFKSWKDYSSFTLNGNQVKIVKVEKKGGCPVAKIRIRGRWYRIWLSRSIRGKIQRVTIKRDKLNDWYVSILTDYEYVKPEPKTGKAAGFDFGCKTFLTCSDGRKRNSPEFYKQSAKEVKKANRDLSRKKRAVVTANVLASIMPERIEKLSDNVRIITGNLHWNWSANLTNAFLRIST